MVCGEVCQLRCLSTAFLDEDIPFASG